MGRDRKPVFLGGKWEVLDLALGNCNDRILLKAILQATLSLYNKYWPKGLSIAGLAVAEFSRIAEVQSTAHC